MKRIDIRKILQNRILILAASMGTSIQQSHPTIADFGKKKYYGCNDYLNISKPEIIEKIHSDFLAAGADILETNSFGATTVVLQEYGLAEKSYQIAQKAAEIAQKAAHKFSTKEKPRFVAGSVGPTNKTLSIGNNISFDELKKSYDIQIRGLLDGGADLILFETFHDISNLKAAVIALKEIKSKRSEEEIPFLISVTVSSNGMTLSGQKLDAVYTSIKHFAPLSFGINCGQGPNQIDSYLKQLAAITKFNLATFPNAGFPDENGNYGSLPDVFSKELKKIAVEIGLNIVGGCCGTTPAHIKKLSSMMKNITPFKPIIDKSFSLSGVDNFNFSEKEKPFLIGERANMSGAQKFRKLIRKELFEEAADIAFCQGEKGASIIDINLSDTETDELKNIDKFYPFLVSKIKNPVMIDSAGSYKAFEKAIKYLQGKCIINSINIGDRKRAKELIYLAKLYGAALVVILIDEKGMAVSLERKLEAAQKSYNFLVSEEGFPEENIIFDPLVFPLGSGDENFYKSGENSIAAVTSLKLKYPNCKVLLGISNCSFGLPLKGREAINSAYLYYGTKAGVDFAIVKVEKRVPFEKLPALEKELCYNLLYDNNNKNVKLFIEYYQKKGKQNSNLKTTTPTTVEEKLKFHIIKGIKSGLTKQLDKALKKYSPLTIINTILMEGMRTVGNMFNIHKITVIEVLQSAGTMKNAVDYLQKFIESGVSITKARILLATVKGDVHDIGKNIVEIVLSNNGYEVIDLGIKISSEKLLEGIDRYRPDVIGLSGLLVRSALEMIHVAKELEKVKSNIPLLLGGAVLSEKFVKTKVTPVYSAPVFYTPDAVKALLLMDKIFLENKKGNFSKEMTTAKGKTLLSKNDISTNKKPLTSTPKSKTAIEKLIKLPIPDDFKIHTIDKIPLKEIYPFINTQMLYGKHFGLKGGYQKRLADSNDKEVLKITETVEEVKKIVAENNIIRPQALYRFFHAQKEGDTIVLYDEKGEKKIGKISFPRQKEGERLCLSDYLAEERMDTIALLATSAGTGIAQVCRSYMDKGEYSTSHIIYSLALETAEAMAQFCHREIRKKWGFEDNSKISIEKIIKGKHRSKRYSPGYSCWPDLTVQKKIFKLLDITNNIDLKLTEEMMMQPEASVTAIVFHHPQAKYFEIKEEESD